MNLVHIMKSSAHDQLQLLHKRVDRMLKFSEQLTKLKRHRADYRIKKFCKNLAELNVLINSYKSERELVLLLEHLCI